jgi:hypothetical protein
VKTGEAFLFEERGGDGNAEGDLKAQRVAKVLSHLASKDIFQSAPPYIVDPRICISDCVLSLLRKSQSMISLKSENSRTRK